MYTLAEEYTRLIETVAAKLASIDNQPHDAARLNVILMLGEARDRYRYDGAPYGDTVAGFLKWWFERF